MNKVLKYLAMVVAVVVLNGNAFGQAPPVVWAKKIAENYRWSPSGNWVSTDVDNAGNTFFAAAFATNTLVIENQTLTNSSSNPGTTEAFVVKYAPDGQMF